MSSLITPPRALLSHHLALLPEDVKTERLGLNSRSVPEISSATRLASGRLLSARQDAQVIVPTTMDMVCVLDVIREGVALNSPSAAECHQMSPLATGVAAEAARPQRPDALVSQQPPRDWAHCAAPDHAIRGRARFGALPSPQTAFKNGVQMSARVHADLPKMRRNPL